MSTRTKILITIIATILYFFAVQAFGADDLMSMPGHRVNVAFMRLWYANYNDLYFSNKLPKDVWFDTKLDDPSRMGLTSMPDDKHFLISFNAGNVVAERTGAEIMLHEMCHVEQWQEVLDGVDHGPRWRACMLKVDMQDGFRKIIIDNYGQRREK